MIDNRVIRLIPSKETVRVFPLFHLTSQGFWGEFRNTWVITCRERCQTVDKTASNKTLRLTSVKNFYPTTVLLQLTISQTAMPVCHSKGCLDSRPTKKTLRLMMYLLVGLNPSAVLAFCQMIWLTSLSRSNQGSPRLLRSKLPLLALTL